MDMILSGLVGLTMDCKGKLLEQAKELAYVEMGYGHFVDLSLSYHCTARLIFLIGIHIFKPLTLRWGWSS